MIIAVTRDNLPGLLAQGVKNGIYWRAVRAVQTFSIEGPHTVYAVYLQFFIDAAAVGIDPFNNINGIDPPHNSKEIGPSGLIVTLTSEFYYGSPPNHMMQWVETYYGKLRMSARTGRYVGAEMLAAWYPRKRDLRYVTVLPGTFMKYILPSAQYMCNYLELVADT